MARVFLLALCVSILSACSLTYTEEEPEVSHVPELVFSDAEYLSYEEGKVAMRLATRRLEQYQEDDSFYAAHVSFETYTKEGELSAEGTCQMISANPNDKQYTLLGAVSIDSHEEDFVLHAQSLRWDGRGEQLITSVSEPIELVRGGRDFEGVGGEKDGESPRSRIEMKGVGFSASAVSRSFDFAGEVSGVIHTRRKPEVEQ